MKYPNTKFTGMSMVSNTAICNAISAYYPNASQTGGAQRLALLTKTTNLDELVDFIEFDKAIHTVVDGKIMIPDKHTYVKIIM